MPADPIRSIFPQRLTVITGPQGGCGKSYLARSIASAEAFQRRLCMTLEDPNPRTIERNVREFLTPSRPLNGRGISPSADHVIVVTLDPKIVALLRKAKLPGTFRVITLGK